MICQLTYDSLRLIKQNGRLLDLGRARFAAGEGTCTFGKVVFFVAK